MNKKKLSIIEHIIDDVLFHLSGQLDLQSTRVSKQLCNDNSYILIDRDGIHQVLLNVLLNAIQAIHSEGRIIISTNITTPEGDRASNMSFFRISVADTAVVRTCEYTRCHTDQEFPTEPMVTKLECFRTRELY